MKTATAIAALRKQTGFTQRELAESLGITITSVSRYENGREPSRTILRKLASVAESARLDGLRDFFEAQWTSNVIARVETLPSAGTQRRVSLDDLKRLESAPRFLAEEFQRIQTTYREIVLKHPIDAVDQHRFAAANRTFALLKDGLLDLSRWIEPYINTPERKEKSNETK